MKTKLLNVLLIVAAFLLTCAAILWGSYFRTGLSLEVDKISQITITAPVNVENRIATERNRQEAWTRAQNEPANLTLDPSVRLNVAANIETLYAKLSDIRQAYEDEKAARILAEEERLRKMEEERLERERLEEEARIETERIAAEGGPDEDNQPDNETEPPATDPEPVSEPSPEPTSHPIEEPWESLAMFSSLSVIFTETQQNFIVTCPQEDLRGLFDIAKEVSNAVLEQGVQDINDGKTLIAVQDDFKSRPIDAETADIGYEVVTTYLVPNVTVNLEETLEERDRIAADYDTVWYLQDEIIVNANERVTEEAYDAILRLGLLDTGVENQLPSLIGVFALVGIIFFSCGVYLYTFNKSMGKQRKESLLLFTLYVIELTAMWALSAFEYYFLPLLIFPMLVSILIDMRASLILSFGVTVVGYFVVNGSLEYLFFFMVSGILISLLSKYPTERNKIFAVGFLIAFFNFALSCAVSFIVEKNQALFMWQSILIDAAYTALNGMLTVIICMGTLPFWETFFGVVTPVKLLDLTNPTSPLLRRLTIEAPGTYHHSLIVANLAEAAAYDIGANLHTARAGGYYHDIGKLKYPQYFAENLAGENPHDHMDPFNSVQLIVSHVAYGLTLASEFRLPQFIRDIIAEHHGTSLIQFFYVKAKDSKPGEEVNEKDFRYPYTIPQTRESACVMLADTVEAAVRSMIPHVKSVAEVENKINSLIRYKLNDGQLADSQLSIKDVAIIEQSFFRVLKGMYHERIPYPKLKEE